MAVVAVDDDQALEVVLGLVIAQNGVAVGADELPDGPDRVFIAGDKLRLLALLHGLIRGALGHAGKLGVHRRLRGGRGRGGRGGRRGGSGRIRRWCRGRDRSLRHIKADVIDVSGRAGRHGKTRRGIAQGGDRTVHHQGVAVDAVAQPLGQRAAVQRIGGDVLGVGRFDRDPDVVADRDRIAALHIRRKGGRSQRRQHDQDQKQRERYAQAFHLHNRYLPSCEPSRLISVEGSGGEPGYSPQGHPLHHYIVVCREMQ